MITKINIFKESLITSSIRTYEKPVRSNYTLDQIQGLELVDDGDNGNNLIYLNVKIDNTIEVGIALTVQIINGELYHLHLNIHPNLRSKGIGTYVYLRFMSDFGQIYTSSGRRTNNIEIPKIYKKLESIKSVISFDTNILGGKLYISKFNPNYKYLVSKYKKS